jgi:hypothetical protein
MGLIAVQEMDPRPMVQYLAEHTSALSSCREAVFLTETDDGTVEQVLARQFYEWDDCETAKRYIVLALQKRSTIEANILALKVGAKCEAPEVVDLMARDNKVETGAFYDGLSAMSRQEYEKAVGALESIDETKERLNVALVWEYHYIWLVEAYYRLNDCDRFNKALERVLSHAMLNGRTLDEVIEDIIEGRGIAMEGVVVDMVVVCERAYEINYRNDRIEQAERWRIRGTSLIDYLIRQYPYNARYQVIKGVSPLIVNRSERRAMGVNE